jgi:hypothetical protein
MNLSVPANNRTTLLDVTDVYASGCNQAVTKCSSPFNGVSSCGTWSRVSGDVPYCQTAGSGSTCMAVRVLCSSCHQL